MYKNRLKNTIAYYDELLSKKDEDNMLFIIEHDEMERLMVQIGFFQHERLVHELVMILFALLTVGSFLFLVACPDFAVLILAVLFLGLLVPYIRHYYGLENGVQRLYDLYDRLEQIKDWKKKHSK